MWYVVFFLLQNKFSSIDSFSQATLLSNGLVEMTLILETAFALGNKNVMFFLTVKQLPAVIKFTVNYLCFNKLFFATFFYACYF